MLYMFQLYMLSLNVDLCMFTYVHSQMSVRPFS